MSGPNRSEGQVQFDPARSERAIVPVRGSGAGYWSAVAVVTLALMLWAPRFSGPIDLRWDASVYYLLGTSLAAGEGYRIPSEPGSPEALQYPPLLPGLVAAFQRALGTADPEIVAPWLRRTYAALFVVYGLAVLALARVYLRPVLALAATTVCLLQEATIFFSDLLFAELPFALISVGFALVVGGGASTSRLRETAAFLLAAAGFLLRTVGVVLLAAWVIEALARRRFRLALTRGLLAVLPIALWQVYVIHVSASDEYVHPAYEYQRAPYQHYNVSYLENLLLVDSFRPELGRVEGRALAARFLTNLARMPKALGETVSAPKQFWRRALLGQHVLPLGVIWVPILGLGALVVAGCVLFIRRDDWALASIVLISIALICLTPWPEQFVRYLMPTGALLTIAAMLALQGLDTALRAQRSRWPTVLGRLALGGFLVLLLAFQTFTAVRLLKSDRGASFVLGRGATGPRFFHYSPAWLAWEEAVAWIGARASRGAIVATTAPHRCYLLTNLRAVYPPMDADPEQAHRLLESVPVSYVIVDEFRLDISRRYALPAVESHPASWSAVHKVNGTQIFARATGAESSESKTSLSSK